jgi:hypothetical protein
VTNPTWRVTLRDEAIEWLERELRFYLHEVNPTQQMRDPDPSRSRARRSPGLRMPPHPRTMTAARAATDALTLALINLAARGLRTHCSNPGTSELWVSDHEAERVAAALLCHGCPVIVECAAADERDERWHVWAGRDYTRRPRSQQAA